MEKSNNSIKDVVVNVMMRGVRRTKYVVVFINTWNRAEKFFYSEEAMRKFIKKYELNVLDEIGVLC